MRRRRVIVGLAVLALAGLAMLAVLSTMLLPPGLTVADADKVRVGMTEAEVNDLFGGRPDNGWAMFNDPDTCEGLPPLTAMPDRLARWESKSAIIVVYFANDRAVGIATARKGPEPLSSKLGRWVRLDF